MRASKGVIYIGGTGRCGTNALKDLFSSASNAAALPFETRFTIDPDGVSSLYREMLTNNIYGYHKTQKRFSKLMRRMSKRTLLDVVAIYVESFLKKYGFNQTLRAYSGWELSMHFPGFEYEVDRLLSNLRSVDFQASWPGEGACSASSMSIPVSAQEELASLFSSFLDNLYSEYLASECAEYYVDDNTFNLLHADTLSEITNNATFVHSIRDPRNVVLSMQKQRWCPSKLEEAICFYKYLMKGILEKESRLSQDRLYRVKVEEIFKNPSCIIRIFSDLGLDLAGVDVNALLKSSSSSNSNDWSSASGDVKRVLNRELKQYVELFQY